MAITRLSLSSILNSPKSDSMLDGLVPIPFSAVATATDVGTGRAFNNAAASVAFAPLSVNGSYVVTANPSNPVMDPVINVAGSSSPIVVTGLPSSAQYTFAVIATNQSGVVQGPFSSAVTVTSVPQAPTIGTATSGDTTASVAFTPGATGGSAVTTYTATSSPGGFTGTGASPITVSGLTNGTAYTFTVTATNANGTSTASAASNSVTPTIPSSYEFIATSTPTTGGTVTFSSIPQTYKHLQIRYSLRANGTTLTASTGAILARFNGLTTTTYAWNFIGGTTNAAAWTQTPNSGGTSGSANSATGIQIGNMAFGTSATYWSNGYFDILDYTNTSAYKSLQGFTGIYEPSNINQIGLRSGSNRSTSEITSLTITVPGISSGGFNSPSRVTLYGVN